MMDYIIIGLLIILIILTIISISKNINESRITERLGKLETNTIKELGDFNNSLTRNMNEDFTKLNERIDARLRIINDKVN